jgi:hypothetical protein
LEEPGLCCTFPLVDLSGVTIAAGDSDGKLTGTDHEDTLAASKRGVLRTTCWNT